MTTDLGPEALQEIETWARGDLLGPDSNPGQQAAARRTLALLEEIRQLRRQNEKLMTRVLKAEQ